jgi:hemerythrin-like metal-binding protein
MYNIGVVFMTRLIWCDDYSVGDGEIDRQHQEIFALIDRLEDRDLDAGTITATFEKLDLYVREHFADEEDKMKAGNYPDLEAHMRQHDEFRDWLQSAKDSFENSNGDAGTLGRNVHDFLKAWMLSHILYADQAYKGHIKTD